MSKVSKPNAFNPFAFNVFSMWSDLARQQTPPSSLMKAVVRTNLEMSNIAVGRFRAHVELQSSLLRCRTPQDAMAMTLAFAQNTGRDYIEASKRIADAWRSSLPAASQFGSERPAAARDYMQVEGVPAVLPAGRLEPGSEVPDRRAA